MPERFAPLVELYRQSSRRAGHEPVVSINSHGFVADTSQQASDLFFPPYADVMTKLGAERGWPPATREDFDALTALRGALAVGSPEQVAEKILYQHSVLGHQRYLMQVSVGTMPHRSVLRAIELLGTEVAPLVRKELGDS
jgi:alkanesulfonate monooxygenase SsuD/methylene tetrahydromethanopterin reductase-like flavin-dependent oxidoreductase (luciferase family)